MYRSINQNGFTLIEIAIVLMVITILLGYTVAMFPVQQELKQYGQANAEMDEIIDSLVGFAQINGRLPCPDTNVTTGAGFSATIDGLEDPADDYQNDASPYTFDDPASANSDNQVDNIPDGCLAYYGYLPAGTLGLNGDFDASGRLLDPWGQPYRYHVSAINADFNGDNDDADNEVGIGDDLVTPNGIKDESIGAYSTPPVDTLLFICDDSNAAGDDDDCTDVSGASVVDEVLAVVVSTGKDQGRLTNPTISNIQAENLDDFHDGLDDKVYIASSRNDIDSTRYDDIVKWISPNLLFTKMIEAERLP